MTEVKTDFGGLRAAIDKCAFTAQMRLGEAVLRDCGEYVPYRTGRLYSSGVYSPSDKTVSWNTSYARECYYAEREFGKKIHPKATSHWAQAALAAYRETWKEETEKIFRNGL